MMAENNFVPSPDPKETMPIVPEELAEPVEPSMPKEVAKQENVTYQEEEFKEPLFGDKAREFEKENNLLRMSAQQIAISFVDAYNNNLDTIKVGEDVKSLVDKAKGAINSWLTGHAYEAARPGEMAAYLGVEVGKEIDNILRTKEGEGWKVKSENIRNKNYWGQLKDQISL